MSIPYKHLYQPPFCDALPEPIYFRIATMPADAAYPRHSHPWGEFVYSFSGVMEVMVGKRQYLAPAQYGLWLPAGTDHQGFNRYQACHCSIYIAPELCASLPDTTCGLALSPLIGAMLEQLRQQPPTPPYDGVTERLLRVFIDQLTLAERVGSYLPSSNDPVLERVLALLHAQPGDTRSVAALARAVHTTERTLMRRCQRDLGMNLAEWRQRLRTLKAMPRLEAGEKVESIALDLGYASASAFIAMFRRLMGVTPDEYRRHRRPAER